MFSIVWKLIILYLCESNIEFYMRVKEIPILLLTGYLGSGKTTLVNHILSNKRGIKFAVIVNDIGEVNIDADLIQKGGIVGKKDESLVALQNGCICCTLKMDLVEQIDDIMKQERFDYIVIEASGVCEPAPIAQTICSISSMGNTYGGCRLDCIVTVVDALRLQSEAKPTNCMCSDCMPSPLVISPLLAVYTPPMVRMGMNRSISRMIPTGLGTHL